MVYATEGLEQRALLAPGSHHPHCLSCIRVSFRNNADMPTIIRTMGQQLLWCMRKSEGIVHCYRKYRSVARCRLTRYSCVLHIAAAWEVVGENARLDSPRFRSHVSVRSVKQENQSSNESTAL